MTDELSSKSSLQVAKEIAVLVLAIIIWPLTFFGVLFAWPEFDRFQGRRDVAAYIRDHAELVARLRENPQVHELSLSPHPDNPAVLLVQYDVADRNALLVLEDDLGDSKQLTFYPKWKGVVRAGEELENDLGAMAGGIGDAVMFENRLQIAFVVASIAFGLVYFFGFRERRTATE